MKASHTVLQRVPKEGLPFDFVVNTNNVIEVSPKGTNECWMKFWDGSEVRSCIIEGTVADNYTRLSS